MTSPAQDSETLRQKLERFEKVAMPIWQLRALNAGVLRSCVNCLQFHNEGCDLASGERPPAKVIALGCDSWEYDIPF